MWYWFIHNFTQTWWKYWCSRRYFSEVFFVMMKLSPWNSTHISSSRFVACVSAFVFSYMPPLPSPPLKIKQISLHQETSLALLVLRPFFPKITFIKGSKVGSHSGSVDPSVLLFPRQFLKGDVLGRDFFGMERWNGGGVGGWMGRRLYVFFFGCFWKIYIYIHPRNH